MAGGLPWSDLDKTLFRSLWESNVLVKDMAAQMGRTKSAIENMRIELGLPQRLRGKKPTHPARNLKPGESVIVQMDQRQTDTWRSAARGSGFKIKTKQIMVKGEVCYRVTRLAA